MGTQRHSEAYDGEGPWHCTECGHNHQGVRFDYICIGCPCDFVPICDAYPQMNPTEVTP